MRRRSLRLARGRRAAPPLEQMSYGFSVAETRSWESGPLAIQKSATSRSVASMPR